MNRSEALSLLRAARVGRLGTVRPGPTPRPHLVPVTYAVVGETIVTMIDHKPKTTERLQRLANIEANPNASLLVDEWSEDWHQLWWVRVDGIAAIHTSGGIRKRAQESLATKYHQYADRAPEGPAIVISIDGVRGWASSE